MTITFIAPHASHPPLDGASARSWGICKAASSLKQGEYIHYYAKNSLLRVSSNEEQQMRSIGADRSKTRSALQAFLLRQHYLRVKHTPSEWIKSALEELRKSSPDLLYIHFLWAAPSFLKAAASMGCKLVLDTHNFDPEWWDNLASSSRWPWERDLALISKRSVLRHMERLPEGTIMVHVSEADSERYQRLRSDLTHLVLPNGCTMRPRIFAPDYTTPVKDLYFLGALNLQMTRDAINLFREAFWPSLAPHGRFHLIGSGNPEEWEASCKQLGWHLHPNLSEADLSELLSTMHYLVLPFQYGAGSKLKFIDACARGIPVISTEYGVCGFDQLPSSVRVSENAFEWKQWICEPVSPSDEQTSSCLSFAQQYSWDHLVEKIWPQFMELPPVTSF
jgi:glycosyltransferase involved in cell wall biosynthesis